LGRPQSLSGLYEGEKHLLPLLGINLSHPACSLAAILNELSRLLRIVGEKGNHKYKLNISMLKRETALKKLKIGVHQNYEVSTDMTKSCTVNWYSMAL
jgi:hypothetical protein